MFEISQGYFPGSTVCYILEVYSESRSDLSNVINIDIKVDCTGYTRYLNVSVYMDVWYICKSNGLFFTSPSILDSVSKSERGNKGVKDRFPGFGGRLI